jgi:hypothetical protein
MSNRAYRIGTGLAVLTTFILIWTNFVLAVDVNTANFLFFGVVPVGIVGAAIARLQARGMALALCGMMIVQLLVPVVAHMFWKTGVAPGAVPVIGLNGVYTAHFAMSALLFRHAARTHEMPVRLERFWPPSSLRQELKRRAGVRSVKTTQPAVQMTLLNSRLRFCGLT